MLRFSNVKSNNPNKMFEKETRKCVHLDLFKVKVNVYVVILWLHHLVFFFSH